MHFKKTLDIYQNIMDDVTMPSYNSFRTLKAMLSRFIAFNKGVSYTYNKGFIFVVGLRFVLSSLNVCNSNPLLNIFPYGYL